MSTNNARDVQVGMVARGATENTAWSGGQTLDTFTIRDWDTSAGFPASAHCGIRICNMALVQLSNWLLALASVLTKE